MDFDGIELNYRFFTLASILVLSVAALPSFIDYFLYYISGQVREVVIQGQWEIAALNIIGFLLFLIPLNYRRKADWKSLGVYSAFIVSLFVEMYGIPLTLYLGTAATMSTTPPATVYSIPLLGVVFDMSVWMIAGMGLTLLGTLIVAIGWYHIYSSDEELVETGLYRYSRHPQYVGILLVVFSWWMAWPTPLTTFMLPIMAYTYYKLALEEEEEVAEELGEQRYREYAEKVPRFI